MHPVTIAFFPLQCLLIKDGVSGISFTQAQSFYAGHVNFFYIGLLLGFSFLQYFESRAT